MIAIKDASSSTAIGSISIDGELVEFSNGETIYEITERCRREVPTRCYDPRLESFGACRLCIVEVEGIDRFSIVNGFFKWEEARTDAVARNGMLATFATEQKWMRALDSLGAGALDNFSGLWIGATDLVEEGTW